MRRIVIGVLAVITAGSVLIMAGTGAAGAATMSTHAATLQSLHDRMATQWQARDIAGLSATQTALTGELATLRTPAGHAALAPGRVDALTKTRQRNDDVGKRLAAVAPAAAPAPTPPDLSGLAAAIQSLLSAIQTLVQSLLGSAAPTG